MADSQIRITADTSQAQAAIKGLTDRLDAIERNTGHASRAMDSLTQSTSMATRAFGALAGALSVAQIANLADAATNVNNKLRVLTENGINASEAFKQVGRIANTTGQQFEAIGDLYQKVGLQAKNLGLSQQEVARITENFSKALAVTGTTGSAAASAIYQFGQAIGRGKVAYEDIRQLQESSAGTVALLGKQFGMTANEFVLAVQQQKISGEQLALAMNGLGKDVDGTFNNMNKSIGQSLENIRTNFILMLDRFEQRTGVFNSIAKILKVIADNIDTVVVAGTIFFSVFAAKKILDIATSFGTLNAVIKRNPLILGATAAATGGSWLYDKFFGKDKTAEDAVNDINAAGEAIRSVDDTRKKTEAELTKEQMAGLDAFFRKVEAQQRAAGLSGQELAVQKMISAVAEELKVKENELTATIRNRVTQRAIEIYQQEQARKNAELIAKSEAQRNETLRQAMVNLNDQVALSRLNTQEQQIESQIRQINRSLVREIRNEQGILLGYTKGMSQEEERITREKLKQIQVNREALAVEEARRQLLGQMTKIESVQRGVQVQQRLDPMSNIGREYQMDMEALKAHLDAKLISEEQYQRQVAQLKRNYADQQNQIYINQVETERRQRETAIVAEQLSQGKRIDQARAYAEFSMKTEQEKARLTVEAGAQMFSALGAQNKKAFEAAKALNIVSATMNAYAAFTKALATYPFPFSIAFAGAALAMGLAQVAQIRAQTYSGRQLGGPVMGGKSYLVGEAGPEIFTPTTTGSITRNSDIGGGGPVNVTFNIVANDTSGFDDLLLSRRGLIRSVISDAMLESGRRG